MKLRKIIIFISFIFAISGCTNSANEINSSDIKIIKTDKHPFLVDHRKKLIVELDDHLANEILMYSDPGEGCNSHLFEDEDYFILIECNGQKYLIDKSSGEIIKPKWSWKEQLPEKYICTYTRGTNDQYNRSKLLPTIEDVYKFKDPLDY